MEIVSVTKGYSEKRVVLRNIGEASEDTILATALDAAHETLVPRSIEGFNIGVARERGTALVRLHTH